MRAQPIELGRPHLEKFVPLEMGGDPYVFDLDQDRRGLLYAAVPREEAVLFYDGTRWRRIDVGFPALSLAMGEDDLLWVAGLGEVGFIDLKATRWAYQSLRDHDQHGLLPGRPFIDLEVMGGRVYMVASEQVQELLVWDGSSLSKVCDETVERLWEVSGELWARTRSGAYRVTSDGLEELPWSMNLQVAAVGEFSPQRALVSLHGEGLLWVEGGHATPWNVDVADVLNDTLVQDIAFLADGTMAFATRSLGVVLADARGRVKSIVQEDEGLSSPRVRGLFVDAQQQLWGFHASGVVRFDTAQALTFFGADHHRLGKIEAVTRYDGEIYILGLNGGYVLRAGNGRAPAKFEPIEGLAPTHFGGFAGDGDRMLIFGRGTYELHDARATRLDATFRFSLVAAERGLYLSGRPGILEVLRLTDDGFSVVGETPLELSEPHKLLHEVGDVFWIVTRAHKLRRISYPNGLEQEARIEKMEDSQWLGVDWFGGTLGFWSPQGLFRYREGELVRDPQFDAVDWEQSFNARATRALVPAATDRVYLVRPDGVRRYDVSSSGLLEENPGWVAAPPGLRPVVFSELGSAEPDTPTPGTLIPDTPDRGTPESETPELETSEPGSLEPRSEALWIGHEYGVVRFDTTAEISTDSAIAPLIFASVQEPGGQGDQAEGAETESNAAIQLRLADALTVKPRSSVRFEYSVPLFSNETLREYRYRLKGFDRDWSSWSTDTMKEYPQLPAADYRFEVESRTFRRSTGTSAQLSLTVLPLWFETWWARLLGALVLLLAIRQLISLRLLRLEQRTAELEQLVEERTQEAIEARIEAEEKVRQAERLDSLGVLAGGVAHDFNNLLVGIVGNAELALLDAIDDSDTARKLRHILTAGEHAAGLCEQMLAYAGKAPITPQRFDLNDTVAGLRPLLASSAGSRLLEVELSDEPPISIGDHSQISQVLLNLAINASEAAPDNSGRVAVRTGVRALSDHDLARLFNGSEVEAGEYVYLEVEDNGEGMTEEARQKLFEPFFTTKFVGRGLGLSTVFGVVKRHAGAVEVDSELGRGTRVRVYFPVRESIEVEEEASASEEPLPAVGLIMVVDDEQAVSRVTQELLARTGFDSVAAASGEEGIELLQQDGDEIVAAILDLSMPGMNGAVAFSEFQKIRPGLPVVVMSGYAEEEVLAQFEKHPPAAVLRKPFSFEQLQQKLSQALHDRSQLEN